MAISSLKVPIGTPAYAALRDQLRKDIVSGEIPHGTRLTIAHVVERYGVSQMPVREALQALQGEGLITISPHKGAHVLSLDARFVRNVYDIRAAIESLLAWSSMPHVDDKAMAQLEAAQRRLDAAVEGENHDLFFELNKDYHLRLYSYSENEDAFRIYDHYNSLLGTLRRVYGFTPRRRTEVSREHWDILGAVKSRDPEGIVRSMIAHIVHGRDEMLASMTQ